MSLYSLDKEHFSGYIVLQLPGDDKEVAQTETKAAASFKSCECAAAILWEEISLGCQITSPSPVWRAAQRRPVLFVWSTVAGMLDVCWCLPGCAIMNHRFSGSDSAVWCLWTASTQISVIFFPEDVTVVCPTVFYSFTREPQLSLTAHWIHSVPMVTMLRPRAGPEEARPFLLPSVVLLSFFAAVVEAASAWQMNNHQVVVCFSLGSSYLNSDGETPDWTLCSVTGLRE